MYLNKPLTPMSHEIRLLHFVDPHVVLNDPGEFRGGPEDSSQLGTQSYPREGASL